MRNINIITDIQTYAKMLKDNAKNSNSNRHTSLKSIRLRGTFLIPPKLLGIAKQHFPHKKQKSVRFSKKK